MSEPRVSNILEVAPRELVLFCGSLLYDGVELTRVDPQVVAQRFRCAFNLRCPLHLDEARDLLLGLGNVTITTVPLMEQHQNRRGAWTFTPTGILIYVNDERPPASRVKTLFHELYEILVAVTAALNPHVYRLDKKEHRQEQERNANKFAAHIKMPLEEFVPTVDAIGYDLEGLTHSFSDTIAGVARQLRDYIAADGPFYAARCHFERAPDRRCPKLSGTLNASGGVAVRIEDIIRTSWISRRRAAWKQGALPIYNVPSHYEWRVMPREVRRAVDDEHCLFLSGINGGSSYEHHWNNLFDTYDLSVLVKPFRTRQERGVFVVAVHPSHVCRLKKQLQRPGVVERDDVYWLFSHNSDSAKRRRVVPDDTGVSPKDPTAMSVPLRLKRVNDQGETLFDFDDERFEWRPRSLQAE